MRPVSADWPWPAPESDGDALHLAPAFPLPDIPLAATTGGSLSVGATPGLAVLIVYPWTGAPGIANPPGWDEIPGAHGSTPELEGFRDLHGWFAARDVKVLALSGQESAYQKALAGRLALPFPILSDAAGAFTRAASLPSFETGGVRYLKRLTVVARQGGVLTCFYPVHPPHTHAVEVQAWLANERGL